MIGDVFIFLLQFGSLAAVRYGGLTSARCDRAMREVELYDSHLKSQEHHLPADTAHYARGEGLHGDWAGVMKRHDGNRSTAVIRSADSLYS